MEKLNCSEMPGFCPARQPPVGREGPCPESPCTHFRPWRVALCSCSCAPACAFTFTMSPCWTRSMGVKGSPSWTPSGPMLFRGGGNAVGVPVPKGFMLVEAVGCTLSGRSGIGTALSYVNTRSVRDWSAKARSPGNPPAWVPGLPSGPVAKGSYTLKPTGSFR